MSNVTVTKEQINDILSRAHIKTINNNNKTTIVIVTLSSGFVIVESSSCVDPANYDHAIGTKICFDRIENKLWELEGYVLQKKVSGELD